MKTVTSAKRRAARYLAALGVLCALGGELLAGAPFHRLASLSFGANSTDSVNHGSANSLDNVDPFTFCAWVYPTTLTNGNRIFVKATGSTVRRSLLLSGTGGNVQLFVARPTSTNFTTNNAPLSTTSKWYWVCGTYDSTASPTGHIYTGDLTTQASEGAYGTSTNGSGTATSDASNNFIVGGRGDAQAWSGRIALAMAFNRVLSLAEVNTLRMRPFCPSAWNCRLYAVYGWAGTGTQPDLSGNGNNGTVTGTVVASHVPTAR